MAYNCSPKLVTNTTTLSPLFNSLGIFVTMRIQALILFILFSFSALAQKDSIPPMPAYDTVYYGGFDVDQYCSMEKKRANTDAKANKLYFIEVGKKAPRYIKYMPQVCRQYKLSYYFMPEEKLGYAGFNPMRCYIASMDSIVKTRYRESLTQIIPLLADSILTGELITDTVDEKNCTVIARLADKRIHKNNHGEIFHVKCDSTLYTKFKKLSSTIAEPIMLASVLVEANGKVSAYRLNYFESDGAIYYDDTLKHSKVYMGCGAEFWQLAINGIKEYPVWFAARIDNMEVRTWHNVEVIFER